MEHIRLYDWCTSAPDSRFFLQEEDLDDCVTEKILQNRFRNPLISSESEDENDGNTTDWDLIFKKRSFETSCHRIFVPGLRPNPLYPRLSALTAQQQQHCLRVLCAQSPGILPDEFVPKPSKFDQKVFEDVKDIYLKEQQEYIEWAKTLWINGHCIRALRPKPQIESVYEAEFRVRANQLRAYPKVFEVVAQIPLDAKGQFEMVPLETLLDVNISELPQLQYPSCIRKRLTVLRPCALPEPCDMHPVRFVLPGEKTPSVLPVTEVQAELARFAAARGAAFVAREGALRCLVERRAWALPVSVCAAPGPDGEMCNVIVLGSEFMNKREDVLIRTFRAYRRLLEYAFVPPSELSRWFAGREASPAPGGGAAPDADAGRRGAWPDAAADSDTDEDNLFIDFDVSDEMTESSKSQANEKEAKTRNNMREEADVEMSPLAEGGAGAAQKEKRDAEGDNSITGGFGVYTCTCKDTILERPPPRSFRKWQFRNHGTSDHYDVIVHCAHKFKGPTGEVLLEPIPEYQADLGASTQKEDRLRSTALSLALRNDAALVNVRIDAQSGDVITIDELSREQLNELKSPERLAAAQTAVHTALDQLQGLVPGHYVLMHETCHGDNALLYAARDTGEAQQLRLGAGAGAGGVGAGGAGAGAGAGGAGAGGAGAGADADAARALRPPPALTPALLPWHKFRKTLPCAFTCYPNLIAKEPKKQVAKQKTPPQAIKLPDAATGGQRGKWPKKRGSKKKK